MTGPSKRALLGIGLSALIVPAVGQANPIEEAYIGAGLMPWQYEGAGEDVEAIGGRLVGGVMFTDHLGVEAHFAWMGEEDTASRRTVELDSVDSVFVRINRRFGEGFDLYALAGYSSVQMVIRPRFASDNDESPSASGVSIGLGAEWAIAPQWSVALDAIDYASEPGFDFEALGATLRWHF